MYFKFEIDNPYENGIEYQLTKKLINAKYETEWFITL